VNPHFWSGKRVFISGHTGFKGSWLSLWLNQLGARVYGYSLPPPTEPSLYERAAIHEVVDSTIGDVRDHARLTDTVVRVTPDIIIHLAAQSIVLNSYEQPIETYSTNVIGTACVLDAARRLTARCAIVNVTTDKVYEDKGWLWSYRENDALGGSDPYSSSKACAELVAYAFRKSYLLNSELQTPCIALANARAGNVIGGGDWTSHQLVPDAIAAFARGRPVVLRNPRAIRPWQHVLDCLSGYVTLAEALYRDPERYSGSWNFGPADSDMQPVYRVVEMLSNGWSMDPAWVPATETYPRETSELRINSEKAIRELNWTRNLPLDRALAWTADWFFRHGNAENARTLCIEQIGRYMSI
jgi:CDP-glucose 4,6-dehydratase